MHSRTVIFSQVIMAKSSTYSASIAYPMAIGFAETSFSRASLDRAIADPMSPPAAPLGGNRRTRAVSGVGTPVNSMAQQFQNLKADFSTTPEMAEDSRTADAASVLTDAQREKQKIGVAIVVAIGLILIVASGARP